MGELTKEDFKKVISAMASGIENNMTDDEKQTRKLRKEGEKRQIYRTLAGVIEYLQGACCCCDIARYIQEQIELKQSIEIGNDYWQPHYGDSKDWENLYYGISISQYKWFGKMLLSLNNLARARKEYEIKQQLEK